MYYRPSPKQHHRSNLRLERICRAVSGPSCMYGDRSGIDETLLVHIMWLKASVGDTKTETGSKPTSPFDPSI